MRHLHVAFDNTSLVVRNYKSNSIFREPDLGYAEVLQQFVGLLVLQIALFYSVYLRSTKYSFLVSRIHTVGYFACSLVPALLHELFIVCFRLGCCLEYTCIKQEETRRDGKQGQHSSLRKAEFWFWVDKLKCGTFERIQCKIVRKSCKSNTNAPIWSFTHQYQRSPISWRLPRELGMAH